MKRYSFLLSIWLCFVCVCTTGCEQKSATSVFLKPAVSDNDKLIALTFDDGPSPVHTATLLDGLKERDVPATFFVIGENIKGNEALLQRMVLEGHCIGNHTMHHKNLLKENAQTVTRELKLCAEAVKAVVGFYPPVARVPGGNLNGTTREALAQLGLPAIGWSVDTQDWSHQNETVILQNTFRDGFYGVRDGAIILMHDEYATSVSAALQIVDRLKKQGYTLVTVPQLLAARKGAVFTGGVYSVLPAS